VTNATVKLLLADVDGTLVTQAKVLTDQAIAAVHELREAGVIFAITSGRPPRGMSMLIEPLDIQTPIAAFNGGLIVDRHLSVIEQRVLPENLVMPVAAEMESVQLDVWVYRGADWYVPKADGPHVARESQTVMFDPTIMPDEGARALTTDVAKLVGVSDDTDAVARATAAVHDKFGDHVTAAASQPYYLDVTHPLANKGAVVKYLRSMYNLDEADVATIGDQANDVLMFAHSGLSIAMGNASPEVKRCARRVTTSNEEEGFANAVRRYILCDERDE
jgi:Cof subfamily protein (haloacid dehalogenase superfamily)